MLWSSAFQTKVTYNLKGWIDLYDNDHQLKVKRELNHAIALGQLKIRLNSIPKVRKKSVADKISWMK